PKPRPSDQDSPAPICRPRRLPREMWTPPGSAPPVSPDTAQSALPVAATARESVARRAAPALARPRLARLEPEGSEAKSRITEPATTGKPKSVGPVTLRTLRHLRKCSYSGTSSASYIARAPIDNRMRKARFKVQSVLGFRQT